MTTAPASFRESYSRQCRELSELTTPILSRSVPESHPGFEYGGVHVSFQGMHTAPFRSCGTAAVHAADNRIGENRDFIFPVFTPAASRRTEAVTLLLHGLNERHWMKYLPWGYTLCSRTKSTVMIIPIAFHMNRSPAQWAQVRSMMPLAALRRRPGVENRSVSFANAALSQRLEEFPDRFVSGGMQTVADIEYLLKQIRNNADSRVLPDARVNLFGYSIGCSLAEGLMMADSLRSKDSRLLCDPRAVLFCGGSLLEYANPVSKAIMDQRANGALQEYFYNFGRDDTGKVLFAGPDQRVAGALIPWKMIFASLMRAEFAPLFRVRRLQEQRRRIRVYHIPNDSVFPAEAVEKTYAEAGMDSVITELPELPGSCHEVPFPLLGDNGSDWSVQSVYHDFFSEVGGFFSS